MIRSAAERLLRSMVGLSTAPTTTNPYERSEELLAKAELNGIPLGTRSAGSISPTVRDFLRSLTGGLDATQTGTEEPARIQSFRAVLSASITAGLIEPSTIVETAEDDVWPRWAAQSIPFTRLKGPLSETTILRDYVACQMTEGEIIEPLADATFFRVEMPENEASRMDRLAISWEGELAKNPWNSDNSYLNGVKTLILGQVDQTNDVTSPVPPNEVLKRYQSDIEQNE